MTEGISRRKFLSGTAAAAAAPYVVPGAVLGKNGSTAPSERIVMGGIGIHNRGMHDLRWLLQNDDVQFVAICDLWRQQRRQVKEFVDDHYGNKDCETYRDLRNFLAERDDIDAILTATGDRWHAQVSIRAMRAGKDVYTEKPSCMTIEEGQKVVETARKYGRVYQTGTQRVSEANHIFCIEMARSGRLGEVEKAYAHIGPWRKAKLPHKWRSAQEQPDEDVIDWDIWLGPCPWRPYNKKYVQGGWRGFYDFHTTCIGEWGAHTFMQAQMGLDVRHTSPVKYEYPGNDTGDRMVCTFENDKKLILSRGDKYWRSSCGERFDGERGWVAAADGYSMPEASPPELLDHYDEVVGEYVARTGRSLDHMRNFLDCVKSRSLTVAHPRAMHRSMTTVHCANIAEWLERDMEYDPEQERFIDDEEANRLRSRAQREPWVI